MTGTVDVNLLPGSFTAASDIDKRIDAHRIDARTLQTGR
jgi:hypothetical protein